MGIPLERRRVGRLRCARVCAPVPARGAGPWSFHYDAGAHPSCQHGYCVGWAWGVRALVLPAQACLRRGVAGPGPRLMKSRCVNSDTWDHARGMNTLNCTTHGWREPFVAQCIFLMPHLVWSQSPAGFGLGCGRAEGIARIALAILEHRGVLGPLGPTVRTGRARARTPNNRDPPGVRTHAPPNGASGASSATYKQPLS